jgi:hypothetical protein
LIFFVIGGGLRADLRGDPKGPLFRTIGRGTGKLTRTVLPQAPVRRSAGARRQPGSKPCGAFGVNGASFDR